MNTGVSRAAIITNASKGHALRQPRLSARLFPRPREGQAPASTRNTSVRAVEKALSILLYLADHPESSLREIAGHIGCSRTSAHRLLNSLTRAGFTEPRCDGKHAFGASIVRLYRAWRDQADLRRIAYPYMVHLRDCSGETVSLDVRHGYTHVCIESVESASPIRRTGTLGLVGTLLLGASGKVYLAAMSQEELGALAATLDAEDAKEFAKRLAELPAIREQGFATSAGERLTGGAAIAAPIYNGAGEVFASITISGPMQRMTPSLIAEIAPLLKEATLAISAQFGYAPSRK